MKRSISRLSSSTRTAGDPGASVAPSADALPRFERLLAQLSARFINLPASQIDAAITDALRQIVILLDVDRSQLIRFAPDPGSAFVTHSWAVDGVAVVSPQPLAQRFPWMLRRLMSGEGVALARIEDLPKEAEVDKTSFRQVNVKSNLTMPMLVGGRVEGAITFGCLRRARAWPPELVERVRVLADVFANALAHKRAQEALDEAIRFEHLVSDTLAALLTAGRTEQDRVIENGLGRMARLFDAERATLWQRVGDRNEFAKTHRWLAKGVPKPPDTTGSVTIPWVARKLVAGEPVHFVRLADLPPEASADRLTLDALGIRSAMMVPLAVADKVVGALSFASAREEQLWPEALIPRVSLVGEVFASMLARQAAERREQEAQAQAAHAARVGTIGMFAASLIHELTQPLAASLANAETIGDLLASPSVDVEELRSIVADIVADDRRVGELIQQLRRFLRRGETEWTELDFGGVLDDTRRLVAKDAAENGITLKVDVANKLPLLTGDRVQLQQVMLNLLLNALDAVNAKGDGERWVTVVAEASDDGIVIEVRDSGPGMDEATAARVFQPFFTTKPRGMGLGLSISHSIVAAHRGRLSVRSVQGNGTTFRLQLPARARSGLQAEQEVRAPAGLPGTVYVIDDDASMRRALERQLRGAGHRVKAFASAQAFLEHAPERGTGCIVSDVRMPGLTGLDLQATLVKEGRELPFVFVSGHGDVAMTVQALKSGAVNFLAKPFTKGALLAAVSEALSRSQLTVDTHSRIREVMRRHESLTSREREVFALVTSGMLNKVIADRLGAAEATIKIHRGRIMKKMNAGSSADLVRMAEALKGMASD
jgi:FixJ family two-component response regulator/signal transduction histidine kinase